MTRKPRKTDTFGWRLLIGAILIAGGYGAWLLIPFVMSSGLSTHAKTMLTACLGAMPLLTKLLAIALLGRPTINYLRQSFGKVLSRAPGYQQGKRARELAGTGRGSRAFFFSVILRDLPLRLARPGVLPTLRTFEGTGSHMGGIT
jgi:hypothetical protein